MALAREMPTSFGGFWYNSDGQVVVGLVDPADLKIAERLIRPWLGESEPSGFVAQQVDYPFLLLAAYRTVLRGHVFRIDGVTALGVDETNNRVVVATADASHNTQVRDLLASLDIPEQVVRFETRPRMQQRSALFTDTTIKGPHPDGVIEAGWQMLNVGSEICTVGFTALDPSDYSEHFVSASHCTTTDFGSDGDSIFQPNGSYSYIGREVLDPATHTCFFQACRDADAALFSAAIPIRLSEIARTIDRNDCESCQADTTLHSTSPQIHVRARNDHNYDNEILDKVGRTSGWTYGAVESTCMDIYGWFSTIISCTDFVDFSTGTSTQGGDSGGPVFKMLQTGMAELRGIVLGYIGGPYGDAVMSDLYQIELDLGSLIVFELPVTATIEGASLVPQSASCQWTGYPTGRAPFTYEWRRDGVIVSTDQIYSTTSTGTASFELSFKATDARAQTNTGYLSVDIDPNDFGIICSQ